MVEALSMVEHGTVHMVDKNGASLGGEMEFTENETIEDLLRKRGFFDTLDAKTLAPKLEQSVPDLRAA